ncbi:ribokinase [uncultured Dysosmobacter sp.]|uniref:ribokinase n=1 Tax=uncultured Dysosmobacter sp. TaxID=2591384 RepID=UPI002608B04C|nr:ribokinase [uncultured Dysosmobacter sp.]
MNRILVFGSVNLDHTYEVPHIVRPGETISSTVYRTAWGGKGLNQAIALAKAGASTFLTAQISEADISALADFCAPLHLDISRVYPVPFPTGHAMIQVDAAGQNCIVVTAGANSKITPETIRNALEGFGAGDMLLLQNEINLVLEILRSAKAKGIRVVLNPSPCTSEITRWPLECVDIFLLNEAEGLALSGETEPENMLSALLDRYPAAQIVLTLGEKGSIFASSTQRISVTACRVQAVDTTAAGDTFTGYFLSGLLRGAAVEEAMKLASCASAIAVSRPGAAQSIPELYEVQAFFEENAAK